MNDSGNERASLRQPENTHIASDSLNCHFNWTEPILAFPTPLSLSLSLFFLNLVLPHLLSLILFLGMINCSENKLIQTISLS